jgi:mannose-6-phosphate isomerase-like protein (cupin superfamily)
VVAWRNEHRRLVGGAESMEKINLREKLELFSERWSPRIVGELNGQHVKLAKLEGEFVWHRHEEEDELFIVPRGVEHEPVADGEVHVLLFEPASTRNTGNVRGARTVETPGRV